CTGGVHYIDGFAGTGQPHLRGEGRPIDGSPVIAMSLPRPFDSYTFIEQEPWRAEQLRRLCAEYPHLNTRVIEADCNDVIVNQVTPVVRWENRARGFAFLDPFAMNLNYATIKAIAGTRAIEIILNLPTMAMNRTNLPNDARKLTSEQYERMDVFWGDHSWFDLIYEKRDGLWGPEYLKAGTTSAERLSRLFIDHRLKPLFPHVTDPLIVKNTTGQPIYSLIFASPNATGKKIADHVFRTSQPVQRPAPATLPLFLM
ncbi:MAG: three-Cys-motif partner protein TcmP, partial [Chloroflexota bacterium]|nr:three-Cys-motif partner protein TcmP [Chloroflexota bacterium]